MWERDRKGMWEREIERRNVGERDREKECGRER